MKDKPYILPDLGKVPPQATDAEASILGICLSYPDAVHEIRMKPEMFYKDAHRRIFQAIQEVSAFGICDTITVCNHLRNINELESVGGPIYISKLTNNIISDQYLENHVLIVKQKYIRRKYIEIGTQLQNISFDESIDLPEVIEYAESSLFELSDITYSNEPERLSCCIDEVIEVVGKVKRKEIKFTGVPSGITEADRKTGGWQGGNLIIIAGRPSMGKTALVLELSKAAAMLSYPVALFSLEMSRSELATRYLSGATDYTNVEIRNADLDFDKFISLSNDVALLPIFIDDTPAIGLMEMRSKIKKLIIKQKIKLVIVDYIQLMSEKADTREQEVSKISRGLKAISKEFNIPVIGVSQLNRDLEKRSDRRPRLSDLRESGALEQDADLVIFVYRPALYGLKSMIIDDKELDSHGLMLYDCQKNRNGALFGIPLFHNDSVTKIKDTKDETSQSSPVDPAAGF